MLRGAALAAIRLELDRRDDEGERVAFWWRDDDAVAPTPALERLIALSHDTGATPALAVIPARAERALVERLADEPSIRVLVHGFAHANHAPAGEKKAEFGEHRALPTMAAEAARGRDTLRSMFGAKVADVFVPPWNRMSAALAPELGNVGFKAISTFGPRREPPPPGIAVIDTHLDPVDWHGSRGLIDPATFAATFARALDASGHGREPVGLLTHHLGFDDETWAFCADLVAILTAHPAVEWLAPCLLPIAAVARSNHVDAGELTFTNPGPIECRP